jgi:galactose-1-phosphate uridylyltransferase
VTNQHSLGFYRVSTVKTTFKVERLKMLRHSFATLTQLTSETDNAFTQEVYAQSLRKVSEEITRLNASA